MTEWYCHRRRRVAMTRPIFCLVTISSNLNFCLLTTPNPDLLIFYFVKYHLIDDRQYGGMEHIISHKADQENLFSSSISPTVKI